MERYKGLAYRRINRALFTPERILDYRSGETNVPREHHVRLLESKNLSNLKWVGDKKAMYYTAFKQLLENNPGAHFIVIYRPIDDVAESFEARAKDPADTWPHGFEEAVRRYNLALRFTRGFVNSEPKAPVLLIYYDDFFYRNETCVPLVARFLGIEIDEATRRAWKEMSRDFEMARRPKEPLTEKQRSYIQESKDHEAEKWVLRRIRAQRRRPELYIR